MQQTFKWIARMGGGLVAALFLVFFARECMQDIREGRLGEIIHFVPYGVVALAGYLLGWWKPYTGGLVLVLSSFLFFFYFVFRGDLNTGFVFGLPALMTGLSYVASVHRALV
jgi:hypothetical protein